MPDTESSKCQIGFPSAEWAENTPNFQAPNLNWFQSSKLRTKTENSTGAWNFGQYEHDPSAEIQFRVWNFWRQAMKMCQSHHQLT